MVKETQSDQDSQEVLEQLFQLSQILNCGIDKKTLAIISNMVEAGISPVAIANIVKEIWDESMNNS